MAHLLSLCRHTDTDVSSMSSVCSVCVLCVCVFVHVCVYESVKCMYVCVVLPRR